MPDLSETASIFFSKIEADFQKPANQMRKNILKLLLSVYVAAAGIAAEAASALKADPAVSSGKLDCGLSYYIVTNSSDIGMADFAVVRKTGGTASGKASDEAERARRDLDSLPHFQGRKPLDYLSANGILYPRDGYISAWKDAVLYHFRDVQLGRTDRIADSTLLMLFDLVMKSSDRPAADGTRVPGVEDQAIIIAGDIDRDAFLKKMDMLSLMIHPDKEETSVSVDTSAAGKPVRSEPFSLGVRTDSTGRACVSAVFYGPEIPESLRGSSVSLIASTFWNEFRTIAEIRTAGLLRKENIPYSSIRMVHTPTADSGEKEKYLISIYGEQKDTAAMSSVLLSVLNDLKDHGLSPEEYSYAKAVTSRDLYSRASARSKDNGSYVKKCVSAFVYGADIVSARDEASFFLSSGLPDSTGRNFLNGYISALLPDFPQNTGRKEDTGIGFRDSDTLLLITPSGKTKVRKSTTGKNSGARIWQFANGMLVVYKKMPTDGNIFYSWVLRHGISSVSDLKAGEGAFYSDLLFKGNICGIEGPGFRRMLAAEGITMNASVELSDMKISGSAPFNRMTLLMKSLLSVAGNYTADEELGSYYLDCERLRLTSLRGEYRSRLAVIDSIICPDYRYSLNKSLSGLYEDLPERAESFFRSSFARADEGALVLVGDMEEYDVRKILETYIGGFRTGQTAGRRPSVMYQPASGWSTYVSDGPGTSIDVRLSAGMTMNPVNYMAAQIASMALRDAAAAALASSGMTITASGDFTAFPHERVSVSISAMPARLSSLPASVNGPEYLGCLFDIRSALSGLAGKGLDETAAGIYRTRLLNIYESRKDDPEFWLKMTADRITDGKNLEARYRETIPAVTAADVNRMLAALYGGSKVEYIIKQD